MRAHLVQLDLAWEDPERNFAKAIDLVDAAEPDPGDLVVLPELFDSGFSMNTERTADREGRTLAFIQRFAADRSVYLHAGRTLRAPGEPMARNMATIAGPDGTILTEYAKIHPFSFGKESDHFVGGDRTATYLWNASPDDPDRQTTVGCAVCYDLRFPELFRALVDLGAEVFVLGANWPAARAAHWRALAIARAIENQACVLAVNRCGSDPYLEYAGGTIGVGPKGEILGELGDNEGVCSIEIDTPHIRAWRKQFPALRDRRIPVGDRPDPTRTDRPD
ncbi:MAG: carbon-nitrogen family hydrolase [Phycisphaerales bacterium]|nr:MAG: carbon-nitrogen family hydrolase [Phycisphaerales bacterium]